MRTPLVWMVATCSVLVCVAADSWLRAAEGLPPFRSDWPEQIERTWVGPEYWASRLQDWRVAGGRLECVTSGGNRNVALLSRQVGRGDGTFEMSVRLGRLGQGAGWAGFRIGTKGRLHDEPALRDWRDDAVRGNGLDVGVTTEGELFIGRPEGGWPKIPPRGLSQTNWRLKFVDTTQGGDQEGVYAFDGDPATFWHTKYGEPGYPHEIQIDLGAPADVTGFVYVPRQDEVVGRVKEFEFYVSQDGQDWGRPASSGTFRNSAETQEFQFACRSGRFVRLVGKSDYAGRPAMAVADLFVLHEGGSADAKPQVEPRPQPALPLQDLQLRLATRPAGERCELQLAAHDAASGKLLHEIRGSVASEQVVGGLMLVCDARSGAGKKSAAIAAGDCRFWFRDWAVAGTRSIGGDDQVFGPILWSQYTLSAGVLKITAQMPPVGAQESQEVRLEVADGDTWREAGRAAIDPLARTATIRVEPWDAGRDTPYRLVYAMTEADGRRRDHYWTGTIRRDPVDKDVIRVAGFTGNSDPAWPNVDLVATLKKVDPDFLFFSGDQIYENVAGFGIERTPLDRACLDYLRKWYFYGWSFRDLLRDRPAVSIPDDHDVYQGNIWGEGGIATDNINTGGYAMDPQWVNMVQRTQTSHLPDPYDPTPVAQGISVYYCPLVYGRISFAVIEDRKFKRGPEGLVPPTTARSDHVVDPNFDPATADLPEAVLLGDRQLKFLNDWAADWRGADFKMVLSQTVLAGAATHHGGGLSYLVADYDSNGWPQTGRNRALDAMRRGFAFHLAGDQHLATLIHHGIEDWDDANWSLAVPSVTNFYMRAWTPKQPGLPLADHMPDYTGRFRDGFGNRVSVWAATNPEPVGVEPAWLHDKKPGFGLVKLDKTSGRLTIECWPRHADPADTQARQYEGWPKTIDKLDNYGRHATAHLPAIQVAGMKNPVVQVIDEADGQIVYTVRIVGSAFRPKVFSPGEYTVRIGDPDTGVWQTRRHVRPSDDTLKVEFP